MLLQTNSYIVPQDKRAEHARLLRRFRQVLSRIGCDNFEVYEQVGSNWNTAEISGRVVQIMRFRDRRHQLAVQAAERNDPVAQAVIAEFCNLINFPYQQQQGLFAVGFYNAVLPASPARGHAEQDAQEAADLKQSAAAAAAGAAPLAASQDEAADSVAALPAVEGASELDASAGELGGAETLTADELPAPALHAEEPLFAEGTEGIIAAAEQLSDEQLDAGGDAAVASAIAGAATGPGAEPSSNGSAEHSEELMRPELAAIEPSNAEPSQVEPLHAEPSHVDAVHPEASPADTLQAGQSQAGQPQGSNGDAAELGDDLDLSSLLDPYLGDNGLDNGHEIANGGAHRVWGDELAHGDVAHDEPVPVKDVSLGGESEHDRNHVSQ
jgi:hypothetical protein